MLHSRNQMKQGDVGELYHVKRAKYYETFIGNVWVILGDSYNSKIEFPKKTDFFYGFEGGGRVLLNPYFFLTEKDWHLIIKYVGHFLS